MVVAALAAILGLFLVLYDWAENYFLETSVELLSKYFAHVAWLLFALLKITLFVMWAEKLRIQWKFKRIYWIIGFVIIVLPVVHFISSLAWMLINDHEYMMQYDKYVGTTITVMRLVTLVFFLLMISSPKIGRGYKNAFRIQLVFFLYWSIVGFMGLFGYDPFVVDSDVAFAQAEPLFLEPLLRTLALGFELVGTMLLGHAYYSENLKIKMGLMDEDK